MVWYWWQIWLIYWWNFVGSAPQWALDGAPTAEYLVWILNCHILSELIWVISDIFMAHHVISQPSEHEHHEPFKYCGPCCHLPLVTYVWSMHKKGHSTWFFFQSAAQKQSPELGEFTGRNEFARRTYLKKKKKKKNWQLYVEWSAWEAEMLLEAQQNTTNRSLIWIQNATVSL